MNLKETFYEYRKDHKIKKAYKYLKNNQTIFPLTPLQAFNLVSDDELAVLSEYLTLADSGQDEQVNIKRQIDFLDKYYSMYDVSIKMSLTYRIPLEMSERDKDNLMSELSRFKDNYPNKLPMTPYFILYYLDFNRSKFPNIMSFIKYIESQHYVVPIIIFELSLIGYMYDEIKFLT